MTIKAILLDLDDTLIVNKEIYDLALARFEGYMRHFGVLPEETDAAVLKTDKEMYKTLGLSRHRYPSTFASVLHQFVPGADEEMTNIARGFAEEVFKTAAAVKPGVPEALELLSAALPLHMVTAGDEEVQNKRLGDFPGRDKFETITIVAKKDAGTFKDVLSKIGVAPEEAVMIGDSLASDVLPALEAGLQAVLIESRAAGNGHTPVQAARDDLPPGAYKFSSLLEFARHLGEHGGIISQPRLPAAKAAPKP